jgi:hypothetical protein
MTLTNESTYNKGDPGKFASSKNLAKNFEELFQEL